MTPRSLNALSDVSRLDRRRADRRQERAGQRPPTVSVVIPALNEAANLPHVLRLLPPVFEVVLVDGGSVDGTVEAARRLVPDVKVVSQSRLGKGNALACGFAVSRGDIVVMLDADGSADPREIPRFVAALVNGADVAKGSRFASGAGSSDITALRRCGNRLLGALVNTLYRTHYTDLCYGYNAFWRRCLPELGLPDPSLSTGGPAWGDGFEIETLINIRVARARLAVHEVPSFEYRRLTGASNLHPVRDGIRVLRTIVREGGRHHGDAPRGDAQVVQCILHGAAMPCCVEAAG